MGSRQQLLRVVVHIAGILPTVILVVRFWFGWLTFNPIQSLQQQTGLIALVFLLSSLACTPLSRWFGWRFLLPRRQALGMYGFVYASLHVLVFVGLDYRFNLMQILADVGNKRYILIGLSAFLLLVPLAITSLNWFKKSMGRHWRTLHKLAYLIPAIVIWHFIAAAKGDLSTLRGNISTPLLYAAVLGLLLLARLPLLQTRLTKGHSKKD